MYREIFTEQFIPDHVFFYVAKGTLLCYDGNRQYTFRTGEYGLVRKNRLAKYMKKKGEDFDVIFLCLEEAFIRRFQDRYQPEKVTFSLENTFVKLNTTALMPAFIQSLKSYYHQGQTNDAFADVKQEELLLILLQSQPELAGVLFDYRVPEKINIEEFMNRNYRFNVSIDRFAHLTGRSLSAFKRDFKIIFNQTPNRWLVRKRLQEAYFLLTKSGQKPSDIYLDLGFETLPHFSFAFKRQFGLTPTELIERTKAE